MLTKTDDGGSDSSTNSGRTHRLESAVDALMSEEVDLKRETEVCASQEHWCGKRVKRQFVMTPAFVGAFAIAGPN